MYVHHMGCCVDIDRANPVAGDALDGDSEDKERTASEEIAARGYSCRNSGGGNSHTYVNANRFHLSA